MEHTLTPLEQQIVRCELSSLTLQQTAHHLNLNERAVRENVRNVYRKLGVSSRLELLLCVYSGASEVEYRESVVA